MQLLVSACLLGICTRYDSCAKAHEGVLALRRRHTLIPVCPEQLGGLPTPRPASERVGGRVLSREGRDVTAAFMKGAEAALQVYRLCACEAALLKQRSPSCGKGQVYDGSFTGRLVPGNGVLADLLLSQGIPVYTEDDAHQIE